MTDRGSSPLSGLRILVVEDDFLIAELLAAMLEDLGCLVIGPVPDARGGLEAIGGSLPDGAVLDAKLGDGATTAPVAEALLGAAVPFVVATGYGPFELSDKALNDAPRITKPFIAEELEAALVAAFAARPAPRARL